MRHGGAEAGWEVRSRVWRKLGKETGWGRLEGIIEGKSLMGRREEKGLGLSEGLNIEKAFA